MGQKNIKLSIVIPAYNEEQRIEPTLERYWDCFSNKLNNNFEIIVIPNGCSDNTLGVVEKFMKNKKNIICKNIPYKARKGGAILEGFKIAKGELIGFVDADISTSPEAFYNLYENINGCDAIIASRWIKGATVEPKQPLNRRFVSRVYNILVNSLFFLNIKDTQCGAKLFKKIPLQESAKNVTTTKWAFDTDLLYQLKRKKYKIKEFPTEWKEAEASKIVIRKQSIEMFLDMIKLRLI